MDYFRDLISVRNSTMKIREKDNVDLVDLQAVSAASAVSFVRLSVTEGKYRMVRRILHNSGHSVCFLRRRRFGEIYLHPDDSTMTVTESASLPDVWPPKSNLPEDQVRPLNPVELEWVHKIVFDAMKRRPNKSKKPTS